MSHALLVPQQLLNKDTRLDVNKQLTLLKNSNSLPTVYQSLHVRSEPPPWPERREFEG